eukprot:TRINITY_DN20076_c0_g2_i1.p1 TRINITY_DN20076_c0_g2~~TRINITY_DN20076_c0_g2_i1.p1  ORF type:complete len:537 (-),score=139.37 TRINITY_DN20076_c0_g2_i1:341-1951(-)
MVETEMYSYDECAFIEMHAESEFPRHYYALDSSFFLDSTCLSQSQKVTNLEAEVPMMAYYPMQHTSESLADPSIFGGLSAQTSNSYQPDAKYFYFQQQEANVCSFSHEIPGFDQCQSQSGVAWLNLDDFSDWSESGDEQEKALPVNVDKELKVLGSDEQEKALPANAEKELNLPARDEQEKALPANAEKELKLPGRGVQERPAGESDAEPAAEPSPCAASTVVVASFMTAELQDPKPSLSLSVGETDGQFLESSCRRQIKTVAAPQLAVSENSWAAQRRRARQREADIKAELPSDEQVARSIKSILNKLSVEKFKELFAQLVACGLRSASHLEFLIHEIFDRAVTQHHFIDMYADLCVRLHKHFTQWPLVSAKAISFKRLLLDECQASFERRSATSAQDKEDEEEANRCKTTMVGNIKLVGALLSRGVLAGKVAIAILEELLSDPTSEALECVALLLTWSGAAVDRPESNYNAAFNHMFGRIEQLVKDNHTCRARERFLLEDIIELRAAGYVNKRPMKLEHATTLAQVAKQASQLA